MQLKAATKTEIAELYSKTPSQLRFKLGVKQFVSRHSAAKRVDRTAIPSEAALNPSLRERYTYSTQRNLQLLYACDCTSKFFITTEAFLVNLLPVMVVLLLSIPCLHRVPLEGAKRTSHVCSLKSSSDVYFLRACITGIPAPVSLSPQRPRKFIKTCSLILKAREDVPSRLRTRRRRGSICSGFKFCSPTRGKMLDTAVAMASSSGIARKSSLADNIGRPLVGARIPTFTSCKCDHSLTSLALAPADALTSSYCMHLLEPFSRSWF